MFKKGKMYYIWKPFEKGQAECMWCITKEFQKMTSDIFQQRFLVVGNVIFL